MSVGRLCHTRVAATANALSLNLLHVRGTYRSPLCAVRNEARDGSSATGLAEYVNRQLLTSAIYRYSSLGDRHLHLQYIGDLKQLFFEESSKQYHDVINRHLAQREMAIRSHHRDRSKVTVRASNGETRCG